MKRVSNLLAALVFASLVIFMSCGGDDDSSGPTDSEVNAEILNNTTWVVPDGNSVRYGDGVSEGDWENFELTITNATSTGGSYSVSGVPEGYEEIWPGPSGSWTFDDDNGEDITRNDNISIDITVSETQFTLNFLIPDPAGSTSRVSGLYDQNWNFSLVPE